MGKGQLAINFLLVFAVAFVLSLSTVSGFLFDHDYRTNTFKETTELTKVTEQSTRDYWNSESFKKTVTEKTEVKKVTRTPTYSYYSPYYSYGRYHNTYTPSYSNWRYKEPYVQGRYANTRYNDYYYKPRYDGNLGYYNWRW